MNQDYGHGGDRKSTDYHLTIDMAKELAMVENKERGRQVHRYFIQIEKEARAQRDAATPNALPHYITLDQSRLAISDAFGL